MRMRKFTEITDEAILFHRDGLITDGNDALTRLTGYTLPEVMGLSIFNFISHEWRAVAYEYTRAGREDPYEVTIRHKDGHTIPVEVVGKTMPQLHADYRVVVVRDITARKEAQERETFLALHDTLTELPNRRHLSTLLPELGSLWPSRADDLTDEIALGVRLSESLYNLHIAAVAEAQRIEAYEAMAAAFDKVDYIISATNPGPAFPADATTSSPTDTFFDTAVTEQQTAAPRMGEAFLREYLPCAYWAHEGQPTGLRTATGAPTIVVVGNTNDPVTPYSWSEQLVEELDDAVLLTRVGEGHLGWMWSSCIRRAAGRYLVSGTPPEAGTTCPSDL